MNDSSMMLWNVLFSGIGIGFFIYGKNQKAVVPLLAGLALIAFTYFMPNVTLLVITGICLMAIPYFIKI